MPTSPFDIFAPPQQQGYQPMRIPQQFANMPGMQIPPATVPPAYSSTELSQPFKTIPDTPAAQSPQYTANEQGAFGRVVSGIGSGLKADATSILQGMSQVGLPPAVTQLPISGQASTVPGAVPAAVKTIPGRIPDTKPPLPLGGQSGALDQAAQDTLKMLGDTPEARKIIAEAQQQTTIKESGARSANQKIVKSLRDQGVTDDQIKAAIGTPKTNYEQFQKLNRLQKTEQLKRGADSRTQKAMDRLYQSARTNEDGTPKNRSGAAVEAYEFFQGTGKDPSNDKSFYDRLSPSQRKEFDRYIESASRNSATQNQERRIGQFKKEIVRKDEHLFAKKEYDDAQSKITSYLENQKSLIKSRDQRKQYESDALQIRALMESWNKLNVGKGPDDNDTIKAKEEAFAFINTVVERNALQGGTGGNAATQVISPEAQSAIDVLTQKKGSPLTPEETAKVMSRF